MSCNDPDNLARYMPEDWRQALKDEIGQPWFGALSRFIAQERMAHSVFPGAEQVFNALIQTPLAAVRVVILGQDPYHDDGQAHGLCFSVNDGVRLPPSLANIFKELKTDLGISPASGCLTPWARQGVLLLNAVLTVRAHEANSHKDKGWEQLTDAIITKLSEQSRPIIFVLWGNYAGKKKKLIDASRHTIIHSAHPSPLSAHNGFFGSRPFSQINRALRESGQPEIDWAI